MMNVPPGDVNKWLESWAGTKAVFEEQSFFQQSLSINAW